MVSRAFSIVAAALGALTIGGCGCDESMEPEPRPPWEVLEPCRIGLVVPADPAARLRLEMSLPADAPEPLVLRAAIEPVGAYAPQGYARFFHDLAARDASGASLAVSRPSEGNWTIAGHPRVVSWEVDAAAGEREIPDLNASTHRREGYTLLSGYATFLVPEGIENRRYEVKLDLPVRAGIEWPVETAHPRMPGGVWIAHGVLDLLDEPIAIGAFHTKMLHRSDDGVDACLVLTTDGDDLPYSTLAVLADAYRDAARAVKAAGAPLACGHVFVELRKPAAGRELGWALEHGRSFQMVDAIGSITKATPRLTYHFAHHMLHAWLPRRLYTDALRPLRQMRGEPTGAIWFAEGFAQYFAFVGLARAGVAETPMVLEMLARRFAVPYVTSAPATRRSMIERSLELSKGHHDEWFFGFAEGALLAMALDERLRERFPEKDGLVAALRSLADAWPPYDAEWREGPGIPEARFEEAFQKASGLDIADLFARHLRGREPLPVDAVLGAAGVVRAEKGFRALATPDLTPEQARFRAAAFR